MHWLRHPHSALIGAVLGLALLELLAVTGRVL